MTIDRMECVVVGAGTAGAAVARRLAIAGHQVMLIARRGLEIDEGNGSILDRDWPEPVEAAVLDRAGNPARRPARARRRGAEVILPTDQHAILPDRPTSWSPGATAEWAALADTQVPDRRRAGFRPGTASNCWTPMRSCGLEPGLKCVGALLIEDAGIVDGDILRMNLRIDAENRGAFVTEDSRLVAAYPMGAGLRTGSGRPSGRIDDVALRNPRSTPPKRSSRIRSRPASAA